MSTYFNMTRLARRRNVEWEVEGVLPDGTTEVTNHETEFAASVKMMMYAKATLTEKWEAPGEVLHEVRRRLVRQT